VYLLRWRKEILLRKRKERLKVYQLLLILNWKAIEGSATYFREYLRDYMKKWVDENKKPDGSDYIYKDGLKIYTTIDSECSCMLKRLFLLTWQIFRKNFYSGKRIKRSICRHLRQRNAAHFDQCNESIKPMVCLKSADKSDEEIIKSFSVKTK
jgi:penicillin-binding protein 1A